MRSEVADPLAQDLAVEEAEIQSHLESVDVCPICGDAPTDATVNTEFRQQVGVRPCNSFSWAITPHTITLIPKDAIIVDSMGEKMMVMEFIAMLQIRCPIQLTDAVWKEFS